MSRVLSGMGKTQFHGACRSTFIIPYCPTLSARRYVEYLQWAPNDRMLYERPAQHLSSLFWGHSNSTRPSAGLSGDANMAVLAASLAEAAGGRELDDVLALDKVCV